MSEHLRVVTFNALADSYTLDGGDYSHASPEIMKAGARIQPQVSLINRLGADVVALQEVELPLVEALDATKKWQPLWSPKRGASDGCLMLVRNELRADEPKDMYYNDDSGHVAQSIRIGKMVFVNTHIKWEMPYRVNQTQHLLDSVVLEPHVALLGDCNARLGELARRMVARAGFKDTVEGQPTAFIANREGPVSLDMFAVRGMRAESVPVDLGPDFDLCKIPTQHCPSDHIPVMRRVILD